MSEITIVRYKPDQEETWNMFVSDSVNSLFMFNRGYMDYHKDRFFDHSLMFYHKEELIAVLPANERDGILYSHGGLTYGGFIVSTVMKQAKMNACIEAFLAYCRENNIEEIVYKCIPHIFGNQMFECDQYALFLAGAKTSKIEPATVVNLMAPLPMAKDRKSRKKKAEKKNIIVNELKDKQSYIETIDLENEVLLKYHGVQAVHTADELYYLHQKFPDNIRLFAAYDNNIMIASTVIFEYNDVVHTQYLAANDEARQCGALDLVIFHVMEKYQGKKQWLDFGISSENNGLFLNEGLISQKEGFGGRTMVYRTLKLKVCDYD